MSIEFRPNLSNEINDDTLYEFGHERIYEDADGSLGKILADKYDNDMPYYFYQYVRDNGSQPLSFWQSVFNNFGEARMIDAGAYPIFHIIKDGNFVMEISLIATSPFESKIVQMSNMNARTILQLLNIDTSDLVGSISPLALLRKIESVKGSRMLEEFTRPDEDGPRIYGGGIDVNYLERKLLELEALADFCVMEECDINWG